MSKLRALLCAGAVITSLPASAMTFDFADLKYYRGANSGFLPTDGVACTGGDLCSSNIDRNVKGGDLTYTQGGMTVQATATYLGQAATVVQDHENYYDPSKKIGAGLGVYHLTGNTSDDNVTFGEKLTLTFDRVVTLSSIGLRSESHDVCNWLDGSTFLLNGVSTLLPKNSGSIDKLSLTGKVFTFEFGGAKPDQFYLSSLVATAAVPEPAAGALLVSGLGLLGGAARRRRKSA